MDALRQAAEWLRDQLAQHVWLDAAEPLISQTPDWVLVAAAPTLALFLFVALLLWKSASVARERRLSAEWAELYRNSRTELFPIPQLQDRPAVTDASDYWDQFEIINDGDTLRFPPDKKKTGRQRAMVGGKAHVISVVYKETKLKAESSLFTQRQLGRMGVKARPIVPCPFEKSFPMYLMRGSDLKRQSRIPRHDEAIAQRLLLEIEEFVYASLRVETTASQSVQNPDEERVSHFGVFLPVLSSGKTLKPWKRILFISHRWLSPHGTANSAPHPDDDDNTKLELLKTLVRDDDYVMMDYFSFPQDDVDGQRRAIHSLCWYIYHCSHFRILAKELTSFEDYLGRGWCQTELLSAFCPVLSRTEERTRGNFYMDYSTTVVDKIYVSAATDKALLLSSGQELPLVLEMIRNPTRMDFTFAEDATKVQVILDTVVGAFEQGRPRKQTKSEAARPHSMVSDHATVERISLEEASAEAVEELLRSLSAQVM